MQRDPQRVISQTLSVPFDYPVVFTRDLFSAGNTAFADAVDRLHEQRRHSMLVYVDSGVLQNHPDLESRILNYVKHHAALMTLALPPIPVPGGEVVKNDMSRVMEMIRMMIECKMCRHSCVVVIGGGAVLDAVGFAAALVHRGLRLIRVPTTVLAQNDAGVGVKNAINLGGGKNLLGTFAPPFAVLNDFRFLETLPRQAWTDGIAEAFKVAIIKDSAFFHWLCENASRLAVRDEGAMEHLIVRCAELHLDHIRQGGDPFETGRARPLDFGHWAAHKLETMSSHVLSHGQAVAIGIALDSRYATRQGWLSKEEFEAVVAGLSEAGLPLWHPLLDRRTVDGELEILGGIQEFREHLGGELCVTFPRGIGAKFEVNSLDAAVVAQSISDLKASAPMSAPHP